MFAKMITYILIGVMSMYPKMGYVQRIENNNCYIVDTAGDVWMASNTDLKVGDKCRLLMSTNGTQTIYDDCILAIEKE